MGVLEKSDVIIDIVNPQWADLRSQAGPGGGRPQLPPASILRNRTHGFQPLLYPLVSSTCCPALAQTHPEGNLEASRRLRLAHWA